MKHRTHSADCNNLSECSLNRLMTGMAFLRFPAFIVTSRSFPVCEREEICISEMYAQKHTTIPLHDQLLLLLDLTTTALVDFLGGEAPHLCRKERLVNSSTRMGEYLLADHRPLSQDIYRILGHLWPRSFSRMRGGDQIVLKRNNVPRIPTRIASTLHA